MTGPRRVDRGLLLDAGSQDTGEARRGGRGRGRPAARTKVKLPPDPYGDQTPRRPVRGRALIILGSLALLFAAVAVIDHRPQPSAPTSPAANADSSTTAPAASLVTPGATAGAGVPATTSADALTDNTADGIPVGYPDSAVGAKAAAANYVTACWSAPMVTAAARNSLVNAIADPAIAQQLQSQLNTLFTELQTTYGLSATGAAPAGQAFVERTVPVGVSLQSLKSKAATVSVWVVTMSGMTGTGATQPVTEGWSTVTVNLTWTHGDWKWSSFSEADGPTPLGSQQSTSSPQAVQSALGQFGGLPYAG